MTPHKTRRNKIFISYSHKDAVWLRRLQVHLRPLERSFKADIWADTKIKSGSKWREEIERALGEAAVAILLVSPDFLASDFIANNELPPLLQAAEKEGTVILPLILNHSWFENHEDLRWFQAFNDPSKPLTGLPKDKQAEVFKKVTERIAELLDAPINAQPDRSAMSSARRARQAEGDGRARQVNREASGNQNDGAEIENSPQKDAMAARQSPAGKEPSVAYYWVIAMISLLALAVAIRVILHKSGDSPSGINSTSKTAPTIPEKLLPQSGQAEPQLNRAEVTIENGGMATIFNDRLKIHLDEITLEESSNEYCVSFSLSSPYAEEANILEMKVSDDEEITYQAGGKLKIRLLAAKEQVAAFSIEKVEN